MPARGRLWVLTLISVLIASTALPARAEAEELASWTPWSYPGDGSMFTDPGLWDIEDPGTVVVQRVNGAPTFFISPLPAVGQRITLQFEAPIVADDDYFGVALGIGPTPGGADDDYLLIDWRKEDQEIDWFGGGGAGLGIRGLALSRVQGIPSWDELWGHLDQPETADGAVTELARGASLGVAGWTSGQMYELVIDYTPSQVKMWVDGVLQIDISGEFPEGHFALYDFSLAGLTASAITFATMNSAPEVIAGGAADVVVNEGHLATTSGGFTDDDGDPLSLACAGDCAPFVDNGDGTWFWSQLEVEGPETRLISVTASDGIESASDDFNVTVHNLAPVIHSTAGLPGVHHLADELAVTADFTDAGVADTHTALIGWGDGTSSPASVTESPGSGTVSGTHLYTAPGLYTVTVTVWDDDGDADQATLGEVFVFDPDTFVTGGGWYQSPAGAFTGDPLNEGKSTFGFVVRYRADASLQGSLQFTLHNEISLHAEGFDTLFIAEGVAEYSGWGRVNGEPGYRFRAVATDERYATAAEDLFWITITLEGATVYDGSALPVGGAPVRGRGIQIHS